MALTTHSTHNISNTINDNNSSQWVNLSSDFDYKIPSDKKFEHTKRLIDIAVSISVMLFVLSWLIPIISLFILISSRGPVLFLQQRIGLKGKPFLAMKFRTMYYHDEDSTLSRKKNDIRITPFGRFLRRSNLDELPQFINVLLGDMSLVGPRPYSVAYTKIFSDSKDFKMRFLVKPGIASLSNLRNDADRNDIYRWTRNEWKLDAFYVSKRSIGFDLKIMLWTMIIMLRGNSSDW